MAKSDEEIRKEWGYEGKPKQWQQGFDCGLKEIRLAESEKDSKYDKLVEGLRNLPSGEVRSNAKGGQLLMPPEYVLSYSAIESLITEIEGGNK